jgi:hypothetical protein
MLIWMRQIWLSLAFGSMSAVFCMPAYAGIFSEVVTFNSKSIAGNEFIAWLPQGSLPSDAVLLTVSVNATLNASVQDTFANDLTIYVDRLPLFGSGGRLQVGGTSNLQAANRLFWANGNSADPGTTVIDTKDITNFNIAIGDAQVWYGNGFGMNGTSGEFSGSLSLTYFSSVPEPGSFCLLFVLGVVFSSFFFGRILMAPASAR